MDNKITMDNNFFNLKRLIWNVSDYFIHSVCNEQYMVEQGYETDEARIKKNRI